VASKEMTGLEQMKRALVMMLAESLDHYVNGVPDNEQFTPRPLQGLAPLLREHANLVTDLEKACCIEEIRLALRGHSRRAMESYGKEWGYLEMVSYGWSWCTSRSYTALAPDDIDDGNAHALRWFWQDCEYLDEMVVDELGEHFGLAPA